MREYNDLVKLAERAALRAADYLRTAPRPAVATWTEKSQHDFVTEVDRAAEGMIAEEIVRAEPDSVIVGEELSPKRGTRGQACRGEAVHDPNYAPAQPGDAGVD